ncbi:hypothetical protein CRI94_01255 [Longibacter salinarum]|uniref:Uncharacterized protein n=2 Tax=Longibacter salinarum TaxID=1850348 RepID=A0A2A8D2S0_9BACT|nr:hypothetical protein CRI94_01255 [Longibacter salinarum]
MLLVSVLRLAPLAAHGQRLPDHAARIELMQACNGDDGMRELFFLQWQTRHPAISVIDRGGLSPVHRDVYDLVEQVYRPYRDPHQTSTWTGQKPFAVVQPHLVIDIVPDTTFARWERREYALDLNWDRPPLVRTDTIAPFRPRPDLPSEQLLYADEPYREDVIDFFLPNGAAITDAELNRRIDCVDDFVGLTDWVRTSRRMHSPPHLSVLINQRRDRAILAFGWGIKGGIWVAYRRSGLRWEIIKPLGRWVY